MTFVVEFSSKFLKNVCFRKNLEIFEKVHYLGNHYLGNKLWLLARVRWKKKFMEKNCQSGDFDRRSDD